MGWLSDKMFGKRKTLDIEKIRSYMQPTQDLVTEQLGYGRDLMDPNSRMNAGYKNMLNSQAMTTGQNIGSQVQKIAAQQGVSPAQAMMQARMGMNNALGQGQGTMMNWMQGQQQQGLGLLGQMTQMQQGLNENDANAYVQQVNAHNAARASRVGNVMGLAGAAMSAFAPGATVPNTGTPDPGSDIALKENIELIGKSAKGVNIYEFDYKDKSYGNGRYRGVMAQEVPNASYKGYDGYLRVNYDKVDVNFERIN
jgi:hypothetical protein